jgi:HSP90 family molecular chaperone
VKKNELQVLIREHIQNSLDAFDKRKSKPERANI